MNELNREFVTICKDTLPLLGPIYEFGSFQVPAQVGFADLRPTFPGRKYIGADVRKGPGVDVILDLHKIDLPPEVAGTVLILNTLEHVEFPRKALSESYRILKPRGICIITSHMNKPIHNHPNDYWRFTPEGFASLLKPFDFTFIGSAGKEKFPHTVVGIGFKSQPFPLDRFFPCYEAWKKRW